MSSDRAVIPEWVVPARRAVEDAHRIAYRMACDGNMRAGGVASAINWVTGGEPAPLSHRSAVSLAVVWSEWELAGTVETGAPMVRSAGEPVPPTAVITDRSWATGAGAALGWLLGAASRTPVPVPLRLPDGRIPTADELYRAARAARPHALWTPEQRAAARQQAEQTAARNRALAELVG